MKKLQLKREVVRNLTEEELDQYAGGRPPIIVIATMHGCNTITTWTHHVGTSNPVASCCC